MPLNKAEAYVLRTYKFREHGLIVVLFTHEHGKIRGIARGVRTMKSRLAPSLGPLNLVEVIYFEKPGKELVTIDGVDLKKSASEKQRRIELFYAFACFCELVDEFSQLGEADPPVFRLIGAVTELAEPSNIDRLMRYFETWLLKLEGVLPDITQCGKCRRPFSGGKSARTVPWEGSLLCSDCGPREGGEIAGSVLQFLQRVLSSPPARIAEADVPRDVVEGAGQFLHGIIRKHLEKDLKTYKALKQL
jgi:DNA repair protein RecO (recombination protein O)